MTGIEISEKYYRLYGEPMLRENFPELYPRIAAGVCGRGSENFGFDDEISRDHGFDPGFYIWLSKEDFKKYEFALSRAYDALPNELDGVKIIGSSVYETSPHGVREISSFFLSLTGFAPAPESNSEWLSLSQETLSCSVNGKIFYDGSGEITAIREKLSNMPRDVMLKKLAKNLVFAAQSGQYNYSRALLHGENGAAALALSEFAKNICGAAFLLNGKYCPFYKWMFASARSLPVLSEAAAISEKMLLDPLNKENKRRAETAAALIIEELKKQNLSDYPSEYLEPHAYEVMKKISDREIQRMHIME
ncbi:MAG: DUF4037 domain-containing protein [Oscillospiraceae bacterium]|nr:DUF4037 domain-containing protein [Oscillospiraceae bacterium]